MLGCVFGCVCVCVYVCVPRLCFTRNEEVLSFFPCTIASLLSISCRLVKSLSLSLTLSFSFLPLSQRLFELLRCVYTGMYLRRGPDDPVDPGAWDWGAVILFPIAQPVAVRTMTLWPTPPSDRSTVSYRTVPYVSERFGSHVWSRDTSHAFGIARERSYSSIICLVVRLCLYREYARHIRHHWEHMHYQEHVCWAA